MAPKELKGVSQVIQPPFHSVANAVGAANPKIGRGIDVIQSTENQTIADIIEKAKNLAIDRAICRCKTRDCISR